MDSDHAIVVPAQCLSTRILLRFFEDRKIRLRCARRVFTHLTPIFSATFVIILTQGHVRSAQVTRSGQVTQLQNNFPIAPWLQYFRESYETFGMRSSVPTKRISWIFFYICDLRSGHFCDLPIISQWAKNIPTLTSSVHNVIEKPYHNQALLNEGTAI